LSIIKGEVITSHLSYAFPSEQPPTAVGSIPVGTKQYIEALFPDHPENRTPHSLTHGNEGQGTAGPRRRFNFLPPILVLLSALTLVAMFELVTTLLFPSITLWGSHFLTIVVSGAVTAFTSLFVFLKSREVEESYRQLVEQSPDAVLVHRQGEIIFANRACVSLFGASSTGQLLGKQLLDFVHPDDRENVGQRIREYKRDFTNVRHNETRLIALNGKETHTEVLACSIMYHRKAAIQVNYRDISLRKQAEKKLLESEASLASAQQVAHLGSWERDLTDPDSWEQGPVRWSDEVFRILGYNVGEIEVSRANFIRSIHPDDRDRIRELTAAALREGRPYSSDYRIILLST